MPFKDMPIRRKLMRIIFLICGTALLAMSISLFIYGSRSFRKSSLEKLSTIGKIICTNSTAALIFENRQDAKEILAALKAEPHVVTAVLYDEKGKPFVHYPSELDTNAFPLRPGPEGFRFAHSRLEGFQPVVMETRRLGTLYMQSDLGDMYEEFRNYAIITTLVMILSLSLAWMLTRLLQKNISVPILALAGTARMISDKKDYSVRAVKRSKDELGSLTDAFNDMLEQIQEQNLALNEFNQKLEQKVSERTIQLENLNKELEAFSYSISHDLRAPLRGIIGFVTILEEDYTSRLDDEARRITTIIKNNTMKMGHLIDDLLAFSRMGRKDIEKTTISTSAMVEEVIREVAPDDKNGHIQWVIDSIPDVKGDINAVRQVWINLISNAVKYSAKKAAPVIEIGFISRQGETIFFIKDNGVGFDEKYKHKLFKVFQRLHSTDDFEGTGVGLAIVEKVIAKHGGRVWAEAAVGKGACFYFSLPD
ncbi:MAG TPA: ATP-binding protein [Puia sp.]|nr:ATP-binding protein [Puia sp.]